MNSIHRGMITVSMHGTCYQFLIKSSFTQVDQCVEHSECVVILSNIETLLMECVHTGIVTIISTKNDV